MVAASSSGHPAMPPRDVLPRTTTMGRAGISWVTRTTCSVKRQTTVPANRSPSRTTALASRSELPFGVPPRKNAARCISTNILPQRVRGKSFTKHRARVAWTSGILRARKSLEARWHYLVMGTRSPSPAPSRIRLTVKCTCTAAMTPLRVRAFS